MLDASVQAWNVLNGGFVSGRGIWNLTEPEAASQDWERLCPQGMVREEARNQVREDHDGADNSL